MKVFDSFQHRQIVDATCYFLEERFNKRKNWGSFEELCEMVAEHLQYNILREERVEMFRTIVRMTEIAWMNSYRVYSCANWSCTKRRANKNPINE